MCFEYTGSPIGNIYALPDLEMEEVNQLCFQDSPN